MADEIQTARVPDWIGGTASDQWIALLSHCTLARNLSDFAFPARCGEDERHAVEARALDAFERINLFGSGRYHASANMDSLSWQLLGERRIASREVLQGPDHRGVYLADGHDFGIMVNGSDHLVLRALAGGMAVRDAWTRISAVDDGLACLLGFAWQERLGFLTSRLGMVGTGLRASVLLHLPALGLLGAAEDTAARIRHRGVELFGVAGGDFGATGASLWSGEMAPPGQPPALPGETPPLQCLLTDLEGAVCTAPKGAVGSLYLLVNQETLGVSEEEILFRVGHAAVEVTQEEERSRALLMKRGALDLEDRAARAMAVARGARLLGFGESLELLSALRLGAALGLVEGQTPQTLSATMLAAQAAHLVLGRGAGTDPRSLAVERARLFRETFTA
jgi:protein arginine kinase